MSLTLAESTTYVLARRDEYVYPRKCVATTLGKNIERLRIGAGHVNAAAFARSIGITAATLNDWESGRYKNLRLDSLMRIARGIPCRFDDLLAGVDDKYDEVVTSVLKSTSEYGSGVAESPVPVPAGTEGKHDPLVVFALSLADEIGRLTDDQRVALRTITFGFAKMLGRGAEAPNLDAHTAKRSAARR